MASKLNAAIGKVKPILDKAIVEFKNLPPKLKWLAYGVLMALSLLLIYAFIKWAFLSRPNTYEWHYENAEQAIKVDEAATLLSKPTDDKGINIVEQIRNNPNGVVGGVQLEPSDRSNSNLALKEVKKSIDAVDENNRVVAAAGGIATLEQVQQTYNGKPENPEQALKVQRVLEQAGVHTGVNVNEGLSDAQLGAAAYTDY